MPFENTSAPFDIVILSQMTWHFVAIITILMLFVCYLFLAMRKALEREKLSLAISSQTIEGMEAERRRISRELHDTVVQDMRRISGELDSLIGITDSGERERLYADIARRQSEIADRLRGICNNLVPPDLGLQGLSDALGRLCIDFTKRSGIECRFQMAEDVRLDFFGRDKLLLVFRIAQEALTNVEKHSAASEALVKIHSEADGGFSLYVCDNGVGFKVKPAEARLGIPGMKERAALLGGSLSISKAGKEGAVVHLRLPPPKKERLADGSAEVLFVDDHSLASSALAVMLKESGGFKDGTGFSTLAQTATLGETRRFIEEAEKMPSLIILDIQLGGENGLDFLPILKDFCSVRGITKPPPVLVCSAFDDAFRVQLALKQGKTPQEIAGVMAISVRTVEKHVENIYVKTGVKNRTELMKM